MTSTDDTKLSSDAFEKATRLILSWNRPLLVTHERPDGDGLSCLIALGEVLNQLGKPAVGMIFAPCPQRYAGMEGAEALHVMNGPSDPVLSDVDGVVILDTCSYSQLESIAGWLRDSGRPRIIVDHHVTRELDAQVHLMDPSAAAATVVLHRWCCAAGWSLSPTARKAIFTGLTADTGWFQYSNTNPEAFRMAADLVESGVSVDEVCRRLFLNEPASKLRLRAAVMAGIELLRGDTIAVMTATSEMFAATGSTPADTEELVNIPMTVGTVELSVIMVETGRGPIKCSFRSKGGIDVARLAAGFGGGGHARAAGARIPGTLESVKKTVLEQINIDT